MDIKTQVDNYMVSTVRLGSFYGDDDMYETMVFDCDDSGNITTYTDLLCNRYANPDAAEKGHQAVVEALTNGKLPEDVA
jgi:hypothetical protein